MSSSLKEESNRANARLSTGPCTPEGKAASSLNSTTHGLSVNRISSKNPHAKLRYEQRRKDYAAQYPHNPAEDRLQADLIDSLATARTRMELIEEAQDELPDETAPQYQILQRYWRDADRCFSRTLRLLENHRAQPGVQARRQNAEQTRAQAQVNARQRLWYDLKRLEYEAMNDAVTGQDKARAAELASFRQGVRDFAEEAKKTGGDGCGAQATTGLPGQ
jgi:hypothetical protein